MSTSSKQIKRKEKILRNLNRPIPTLGFKNVMTEEEYIIYLNEQIKEHSNIAFETLKICVALDMECDSCPICMESLHDNDDISSFTCNHYMHSHCLFQWVELGLDASKCCPLCRNENCEMFLN
jgi:hypothetical protein